MYIPGGDFSIVDEAGEPVAYTVLKSRDLTDYVLSQTIRLDPSANLYIPDQVLEVTIAIEAHQVPALGYAQYRMVLDGSTASDMVALERDAALENEFYRVSINADGSLRVEEKATGYVYDNQAILEENGDDGDSFNYSPPRQDLVVRSCDGPAPQVQLAASDIYATATIVHTMTVPATLEERAQGVCSAQLPVTLTVGLRRGSRAIDVELR